MDTNTSVELLLGHAALECNTNTLGDLASIWAQDVEANNLVGGLLNDGLHVARASLIRVLEVKGPLKWLEVNVEDLVIVLVFHLSFLFRQADSSILKWSENSGWYVVVVHQIGEAWLVQAFR